MLVQIKYGDTSADGHGQWSHFFWEINKSLEEFEAIYAKAYKLFRLEEIAHDYGDSSISNEILDLFSELGFVPSDEDFYYEEEDETYSLQSDSVEALICFAVQFIDQSLTIEKVEIPSIDADFGYGLFV